MKTLRAIDEWLMRPVGPYVRYHFLLLIIAWAAILVPFFLLT